VEIQDWKLENRKSKLEKAARRAIDYRPQGIWRFAAEKGAQKTLDRGAGPGLLSARVNTAQAKPSQTNGES